jgi:hypothetical protein
MGEQYIMKQREALLCCTVLCMDVMQMQINRQKHIMVYARETAGVDNYIVAPSMRKEVQCRQ